VRFVECGLVIRVVNQKSKLVNCSLVLIQVFFSFTLLDQCSNVIHIRVNMTSLHCVQCQISAVMFAVFSLLLILSC